MFVESNNLSSIFINPAYSKMPSTNVVRLKNASKPRIAVAGIGLIGQKHAQVIANSPGTSLAALVDPRTETKRIAEQWGVNWYPSLPMMFSSEAPDGVVISTPNTMHVEHGLQAINARCPMLIEKPIATSTQEGELLLNAARNSDVPVLVGHHRRHNPIIHSALQIIESGRLGKVRAVHLSTWFYKPDDYFAESTWRTMKGAGPIAVNLIHDIDLIRYLCGEITSVYAATSPSSRGFETEDAAAAVFSFASGAVGTLTLSDSIVAPWSWEMTAAENPAYPATNQSCYWIGGTHASLSLPDLTIWEQNGSRSWWKPLSATTEPRENTDPLYSQMSHFAKVIAREESPMVSAEEALSSLEVIEAIRNSARSGTSVELSGAYKSAIA